MDIITLEEFTAEIETTFKNYADTNDINRTSIKTWVIEELRKFGKNICDTRETIVDIKEFRGLLPETFKSMNLAIKLNEEDKVKKSSGRSLIVERQKVENPAYWSDVTRDYFVDFCNTKITTEKVYTHYDKEDREYTYEWLSLAKGIQTDTIATNCLNLHPSIRGNYDNTISITRRTINSNFREGKIYFQYNSLPADEEGEIAIPIISTGEIKQYLENYVKIRIAEELAINDKNAQALTSMISLWLGRERALFIGASSESAWNGLPKGWDTKMYQKNRQNQDRYNLPK